MSCTVCNHRLSRSDVNIECGDCGIIFHGSCVKITAIELDFIKKSKSNWRCNKCTNKRRASFSKPSNSAPSTPTSRTPIPPTTTKPPAPLSSQLSSPPLPPPTYLLSDVSSQQKPKSTTSSIPPTDLIPSLKSHQNAAITLEMIYAKILSIEENQKNQIDTLIAKYSECEKRIYLLETKVNHLEQQLLVNGIDIVNVPTLHSGVSCNDIALKVFREGLNLNVNERDIDQCYMKKIKLAKPTANGNVITKNILHVRLASNLCKEKIMKAKRDKREPLTTHQVSADATLEKMYINESLSHETRRLFKTATTMKTTKNYKYVWTRNGTIYMRKKEGDNSVRINCFADFLKL